MAEQPEAGCAYCRDRENTLTDGLASGPVATYLLQCPRCGQYWGGCGVAPHFRPSLTVAEAKELFPEAFTPTRSDS